MGKKMKFKAYIKSENKIIDSYSFNKNGQLLLNHSFLKYQNEDVEQFEDIGIYDKTNKLIYNGDIIEFTYRGKIFTSYVTYICGEYCIDALEGRPEKLEFSGIAFLKNVKVVGHINIKEDIVKYNI